MDKEQKIAEIREALEKATPGPWAMIEPIDEVWQSIDNTKIATVASNQDADANLRLIANAPEWLGFLLGELEGLEREYAEEREKMIKALKFYANEDNWRSGFVLGRAQVDGGERAQAILDEIGVTVE